MGRTERKTFDDDELHWYAIDVVRQKEYAAGLIFQRRGCMTFIPTRIGFQKKSHYSKGKLEVARPDLPGVVFVGFPGPPAWFSIMSMHLVNGVLSVDGHPRRIDTASKAWLDYRGSQLDGSLVIERHWTKYRGRDKALKGKDVERSVALVQVQGRGVIRSPLNLKARAASNRPVVVRVAGERARIIGDILKAKSEAVAEAA